MNLLEFCPTPQGLIDKMLTGIDFLEVDSVLEPSAGKGDIAEAVAKRIKSAHYRNREYAPDIDCIELDEDLRGVLKNKKYRVVHDDFLTYRSLKKYELIIMNPPFSDGDKHLMKAIELQEVYGGAVVCLLNAETLRNPYSNLRKTLVRTLGERGADIEYLPGEFESAERKTSVEVELIRVVVPEKANSIIIDHLEKAQDRHEADFFEPTAVTQGDFIKVVLEQYDFEVKVGVNIIREYLRLRPYIMNAIGDEAVYKRPILKLEVEGGGKHGLINAYISQTRLKYWRELFRNKEFTRSLTNDLQNELHSRINDMQEYEFSYHNIMEMRLELNRKTVRSIEDTIVKLFEDLSHRYSWYDETSKNIHYYNGRKTNSTRK